MNEVTAKILTILENQGNFPARDGSGTFHKHGIIYEGSSQVWELLNMSPTCTEFKVGEVATFTTETKQNGQFTNNKIRPVKTAPAGGGFKPGFKPSGGGGFKPKDPKTERLIVIQSVFAALCNKTQGSTITTDQVWAATKKIYDEMMSLAAIPHNSEAIVPAPVAPVVEVAPAPVPSPVVPKPVVKKAAPVVQPNPLEQFNNEEEDSDLPF
jgi:hypothetical protein